MGGGWQLAPQNRTGPRHTHREAAGRRRPGEAPSTRRGASGRKQRAWVKSQSQSRLAGTHTARGAPSLRAIAGATRQFFSPAASDAGGSFSWPSDPQKPILGTLGTMQMVTRTKTRVIFREVQRVESERFLGHSEEVRYVGQAA